LAPHSIRFSYSTGGSSIRKLSAQEAVALIDKLNLDSESAQIDREKLSGHIPRDTPLAQVQRLCGYYKANVFLLGEEGLEFYKTIPVFLPIFYPHTPDIKVMHQDALPPAHVRGETKRKNGEERKPRNDKKLESEPLATSIRVYAYKSNER
jgi:hypothetical protein